ncbi:MAG: peroxiredoxin family protein [Akkermansiaceae bacterium]
MRIFLHLTAFSVLTLPTFAGTATKARSIVRSYDLSFKNWVEQVQAAKGKDAQIAAWNVQPNPDETGRNLWREIRNNLNESWTLEYAAWLYENSPVVVKAAAVNQKPADFRIRSAVERFHLGSPRVGSLAVAISRLKDPSALGLLEKIEKENPDSRVQGAAAMGQAMILRTMGNDWKVIGKRQDKLRKAIIQGHDLPVGKTTIIRLAEDEVFSMNNLEVSTSAPDIKGIDIAAKPFSLSDYRGKIVVLVFWHTWMFEANRSIKNLRQLHQDLQGKDAVVIGVNQDHPLTLRKMTADGETPWRNFSDSTRAIAKQYRIGEWPKVFVLDGEGKIAHVGPPGAFVNIAVDSLLAKKGQ